MEHILSIFKLTSGSQNANCKKNPEKYCFTPRSRLSYIVVFLIAREIIRKFRNFENLLPTCTSFFSKPKAVLFVCTRCTLNRDENYTCVHAQINLVA